MEEKSVKVDKETWKQLSQYKLDKGKTIKAIIKELVKKGGENEKSI